MSGGVPPGSRAKRNRSALDRAGGTVKKAARLFERFTGHDAEPVGVVDFPDLDGVAVAQIGRCDGVLYTTMRDGKTEKYIHEFAAKDAPMLCVTPDGRTVLLVGGNYRFTERGIVDKSWRGD